MLFLFTSRTVVVVELGELPKYALGGVFFGIKIMHYFGYLIIIATSIINGQMSMDFQT